MAEFLQCNIILVDNIEDASKFFQIMFESPVIQMMSPFQYSYQKISEKSTLTLVDVALCDEKMIAALSLVAVRRIFVLDDLAKYPSRINALGKSVKDGQTSYVIEGPEHIVVHLSSNKTHTSPHELLINSFKSITIESECDDNNQLTSQINARRMSMSHARPIIHTLEVSLQDKNSINGLIPCPPNSRKAIPFETDIFKGKAVLVVRTNPPDLHYRSFFLGKRMFEVQVQGKFKRLPKGEIYVGADCEIGMQLGLLTKSFCHGVLRFTATMVKNLHYSFGDSSDDPNRENAHVVSPLFSTMDKILITAPGETPPELGIPFTEDLEYRKTRLKSTSIKEMSVDLETIYSFSVNTSNMDLCSWEVVGIPMLKQMSLRTLYGASPIRLVAYELPQEDAAAHPGKHPNKALNYVFNLMMTPVDSEKEIDFAMDHSADEAEEAEDQMLEATADDTENELINENDDNESDENDNVDDDDQDHERDIDHEDESDSREQPQKASWRQRFMRKGHVGHGDNSAIEKVGPIKLWRRRQSQSQSASRTASSSDSLRGGVGNWLRREIGDLFSKDGESPDEILLNDNFFEKNNGDLSYCPACIEFADNRKDGRRRIMYLFVCGSFEISSSKDASPKLRTYQEFSKSFSVLDYGSKLCKNTRISEYEKCRREIVATYQDAVKAIASDGKSKLKGKLEDFLGYITEGDRTFLENSTPIKIKPRVSNTPDKWEGILLMATDRRHWIEKAVVVNSTEVKLSRHTDSRRSTSITIGINSIFCVRSLTKEEAPFPYFSYFQLETFSRVYTFMAKCQSDVDLWINVFITLRGTKITQQPNLKNSPLPSVTETEDLFFGRPSGFKLDKKRTVFNYRRILFHTSKVPVNPVELVESILDKAFQLQSAEGTADEAQWVDFMDSLCLLQTINVATLTDAEKICVLLNLYHTMVLHGSLLLGPPASWSSWPSFFNHVSYMIGFDVLSINELEHNGLRASMTKPASALLSKISVPASAWNALSLSQRDFRLNFCINCGSRSIPGYVPIFKPSELDRQMDEVTSLVLAETCRFDLERKSAVLPRLCSWYQHDFSRRQGGAVLLDCIRIITPYLQPDDANAMMKMLEEGITPSIRFRPFAFRCRALIKLEKNA